MSGGITTKNTEEKLKCPHCGNEDCFIDVSYVTGVVEYRISLKTHLPDNGTMYDGLNHKHNKYMLCEDCRKRAFTSEAFERYKQQNGD